MTGQSGPSAQSDGNNKNNKPDALQIILKYLRRFGNFLLSQLRRLRRGKDESAQDYLNRMRGVVFMGVLLFFGMVGLCFFARPKESAVEKRTLAAFPTVSASGLWDGSFFSGVETWYADTYPMREGMLKAHSSLEDRYGIRTSAIYGGTAADTGDEIPDIDTTGSSVLPDTVQTIDSNGVLAGFSPSKEDGDSESAENGNGTDISGGGAVEEVTEATTDEEAVTESIEVEGNGAIWDVPETAGTIYVADGCGFELYSFKKDIADSYAATINTVKNYLGSLASIYVILIPNSAGINLSLEVQESVGSANQNDAINYMYSLMDDSVTTVSIYNYLRGHNDEYLYFHTDHHWTQLGAYYAYRKFCEARGFTPHELSEYEECVYPGFLGTLYAASGQSPELAANEDTVYAYKPIATNDETMTTADGQTYSKNIINDATDYASSDKYMCFIGGDQPYIEIDNPDLNDGSTCILVKESYGNCFAPFLVDHYDKLYIIDYRYYTGDITSLVRAHQGADLIFANNMEIMEEMKFTDMIRWHFSRAVS